jgi:heme exporter protein B
MTIDRGLLFFAKLTVNMLALLAIQVLLVPVFFALADLRPESCCGALMLVSALATPALAAIGTLISSLTDAADRSGQLLMAVSLPLAIPIILAAAEATRLAIHGPLNNDVWRWVQLLGGAALIFVTAGWALFEHAVEN